MKHTATDNLSEAFLCRLTTSRLTENISDITSLKKHIIGDLAIDEHDLEQVLSTAQSKKIIKIQNDAVPFLSITDGTATGVQRLMRKFCKRYYGEVSPLIDRKTIQAVLHRHGANFDLDQPEVIKELQKLEDEGLIRLIGKDEGFLKLLGAE